MTDKEKILAKIELLLNETNYESFTDEVFGRIQSLKELKSYINSLQEEPISEDLEEAANSYIDNWYKLNNLDKKSYPIDVEISKNDFKAGAKWKGKEMQSTIELAEDHAMFAGMEKMKEEMLAKAIDAELYSDGMLTPIIGVKDKEKISDIKFGDKVKFIIIKNT